MATKARSQKKVQSVSSQDAQKKYSAQDVADAFISQYYKYLHEIPEEMHKFYKEESTLTIPVGDGSIRSATTIKEIHEAILESDITDRDIILLSVQAQDSIANSIVIGVVGELSKDNTMKRFSQTFLLAPQATGFYLHNDFFRFLNTDDNTGQGEKKSPANSQDEVEQKKSYATILAEPRLPTKTESSSAARVKPSAPSKNIAKTVYVKNLPQQTTRRALTSAVKKYGTVKHRKIQIRKIKDEYRYAFIEFNSYKAANLAVEDGFIQFDGCECIVEYKKDDPKGEEECGAGSDCDNVGDNKSGGNNGKADGSQPVL